MNDRAQQRSSSDRIPEWMRTAGQLGYAAKGVVYLLMGGIAFLGAIGYGSAAGQKGALRSVLDAPFGRILLTLMALGLAAYALWRLVELWKDPHEAEGTVESVFHRVHYLLSALAYGGLAFYAAKLVLGAAGGGGMSAEEGTAFLLDKPMGRWLVGAVGVGFVVAAGVQFYDAYQADFREHLRKISGSARDTLVRLGRFGLAARGVVFGIIAVFFLLAALRHSPEAAGGWDAALETLEGGSHGPWLLGVVALGVVAYGLFQLAQARYRDFG